MGDGGLVRFSTRHFTLVWGQQEPGVGIPMPREMLIECTRVCKIRKILVCIYSGIE